jgi:2'-5' RNA ligase
MPEVASSFEDAWERFRARDSLRLAGDTLEGEWTRGRAQYLAFLVRVEDPAAREHLARIAGRLAGIPGVEPYPDWYWHITVKGVGFQVIKRAREDDVLRQTVPRIADEAQALLAGQPALEAQLGLANGVAEVAFVEVWDGGRMREVNSHLAEGMPQIPRYPVDGVAFLPHISITRFTSNDGLDELKAALAEVRSESPGPTFPIRRIELVKVWLSEETPEFETLATYSLARERSGRGAA